MGDGAETWKNVAHRPALPPQITTGDLRSPEATDMAEKPPPNSTFRSQVVALKGWYNQKSIYVGSCDSVTQHRVNRANRAVHRAYTGRSVARRRATA